MPSPFPGMNPYLESPGIWHTFHGHFCFRCLEVLEPQVAPNYLMGSDENVYLHELPADERRPVVRPDVFVTAAKDAGVAQNAGGALVAPIYARVPHLAVDEERLPYLTIRDRKSRELVTVIELLSPSNKKSDRLQYIAKRQQYMEAGVSLVEIDLLRAGDRMPVEGSLECDYCVMVFRPQEAPRIGIWPIKLRDPLPDIPVPLRAGEKDAVIALQSLLHLVYDAGSYRRYIYWDDPEPPLSPEDQNWARQQLAERTEP
ncbi:MAG TPA: DUF4058 family protein [Tepidisphaeraceae bacterium]|nr:DUF4058 family protein [Tepidisphaeraceae bacterium]